MEFSSFDKKKLAYFEIGYMFFHNDRVDESIPYFEKTYELDPSFEFVINHLSSAYRGAKQEHQKNIDLAEKSLKIYPDDPNYQYNQMFSYLWAGKFDDYFSIVRKIDDSEIQNIDIDLAFGYGYYITGDYKELRKD